MVRQVRRLPRQVLGLPDLGQDPRGPEQDPGAPGSGPCVRGPGVSLVALGESGIQRIAREGRIGAHRIRESHPEGRRGTESWGLPDQRVPGLVRSGLKDPTQEFDRIRLISDPFRERVRNSVNSIELANRILEARPGASLVRGALGPLSARYALQDPVREFDRIH